MEGEYQVDKLRKCLPRVYPTIPYLCVDCKEEYEEEDEKYYEADIRLDDFTGLHSLSIFNAEGKATIPTSLQRLCVHDTNLWYSIFSPELDTLWMSNSKIGLVSFYPPPPFKRLYLTNESEVHSCLLEGCSSTLEYLFIHDTRVFFPTQSLYPRLSTLVYDVFSEVVAPDTLHSLLRGSVLTHLNCTFPDLPSLCLITRHATRLVYLELRWNYEGDYTETKLEKGTDAEKRYLISFFEALTQLNLLQHLTLYGPPFFGQSWVKYLPSSSLAFPCLRSFTTVRPNRDDDSSDTPLSVAKLELDSVTLWYSTARSRVFHMRSTLPRLPTTLWRHSDAPPWEHIHPDVEYNRKTQWTRSKIWLSDVLPELLKWCDRRDAVVLYRPTNKVLTPVLLLDGAIFHTTCPYPDDCVCRL